MLRAEQRAVTTYAIENATLMPTVCCALVNILANVRIQT